MYSYVTGLNGHYEIALSVSNYAEVDREFERITAAKGKAVMPPMTMPWGQRTCYIADPEGNLVEIGSFEQGDIQL